MSLDLDERQRAMLEAMHVKVWFPQTPVQAAAAAETAVPARPATAPVAIAAAPEKRAANDPPMRTSGQNEPENRPVARAPRPAGIGAMDWPALQAAVAGCQACRLCERRKNTVFGVGQAPAAPGQPPRADWLIVGEAPGENEDLQGEPFVGQAGKLLDNMLKAIGLDRHHNVFIANVLKCRPPGNRNPEPEEVAQCEPYLRRQVELLQPRIILAMGRFAVQSLLQTTEPIGRLRGRSHTYHGVPVIVTYHPAYLLRSLPDKAKAWADLCLALELMQQQAGSAGPG
ncbi:uracil-DNA glycosylase [Variovorax terrae]|uniref:Type-4 uracil-DNA glycosylase n=1 Tax=Variovorax terrae TaxID=2923278 RepID=A0A9X1W529_9BURK|nr:uracil-DNA glycosylase [Variovorax terrae]MCJ0765878.1 uracil-DNA glycosylase [Variovorax terrae]